MSDLSSHHGARAGPRPTVLALCAGPEAGWGWGGGQVPALPADGPGGKGFQRRRNLQRILELSQKQTGGSCHRQIQGREAGTVHGRKGRPESGHRWAGVEHEVWCRWREMLRGRVAGSHEGVPASPWDRSLRSVRSGGLSSSVMRGPGGLPSDYHLGFEITLL